MVTPFFRGSWRHGGEAASQRQARASAAVKDPASCGPGVALQGLQGRLHAAVQQPGLRGRRAWPRVYEEGRPEALLGGWVRTILLFTLNTVFLPP